MAEPPHTKDRGRLYWEAQIFGPNPFPSDDPRHGWWRQMAAWAAEADERLDAAIRLRNQDGRGDSWPVDLFVGRLDIIAEALLRSSVRDFEDAAKFKAVLAAAADQYLGAVQSMTMPYVQKESLVWDLRSTLSQRSAYWFAEALKVAREAEEQLAQNPVASAPHPSRREAAAVARTAVEPEAATRPFPVSEFDLNSADGRRKAIEAFLEASTKLATRRLTKTDIWKALRYKTPRQFEYWQAASPSASSSTTERMRRILDMTPAEFAALAEKTAAQDKG